MKKEEAVFILKEKEIMDITNFYAQKENIKITQINFVDNDILVKGIIKKIFSLEFTCRIYIQDVKDEKIEIIIRDIKALKINLYSLIENITKKDYVKNKLGSSLKFEEDKIYIDLKRIKKKFPKMNFNLKNLKVQNNELLIKFINLDIGLEKNKKIKFD